MDTVAFVIAASAFICIVFVLAAHGDYLRRRLWRTERQLEALTVAWNAACEEARGYERTGQ